MKHGWGNLGIFRGLMLLTWVVAGSGPEAHAYPSSIGLGYGSCATCHYNTNGNGPLTDYGRALFATAYAAKPWISALGKTDEELGAKSGFLGSVELPSFLRPYAGFRGLYLVSDLGGDASSSRFIPMDAHAGLTLKFFKDRVYLSGSLALAPSTSVAADGSLVRKTVLVTREHQLTVRPWKFLDISAGFSDITYGIRVPEHNSWIRSLTGLDQRDQTHGVIVHLSTAELDFNVHGFLGNLFQEASLRQAGVSVSGEVEPLERIRFGASFLTSGSEFRNRTLGAIHARVGFLEGSSLLAQFGVNREDHIDDGLEAYVGDSLFLQSTFGLARGWNLLFTFEHAVRDFGSGTMLLRAGPSLQYFPMQRVELRMDLTSTRTSGTTLVDPDILGLQTQIHLAL